MSVKKLIDVKSTKDLAIGMFYYTSGSILGPLVLFAGLGYVLDNVFNTSPKLLITGIIISFVTTNILLFKKIKQLNRTIAKHSQIITKHTQDEKEE